MPYFASAKTLTIFVISSSIASLKISLDSFWVCENVLIIVAKSWSIPSFVSAETFNHNAYGNDIVETSVFDASYIKLRQVSLSYSLPKSLVSDFGLESVSFSVSGRNLAILYKKAPHIDPETGFASSKAQQGQEFGQLPSARSIGFSLNIKF